MMRKSSEGIFFFPVVVPFFFFKCLVREMSVPVETPAESWQGHCCERSSSLEHRIIVRWNFSFSFSVKE